jgi:hypothetical protein
MFWARQARPLWMVHSDLSLFWKSDRVSAHESPFSDPTLWRLSHLSCSLFCPSFLGIWQARVKGSSRSRNLQPRCSQPRSGGSLSLPRRPQDAPKQDAPKTPPRRPQDAPQSGLLRPLPSNPRMYIMTQNLFAPVLLATLMMAPREQRSAKTRPQSRLGDRSGLHP